MNIINLIKSQFSMRGKFMKIYEKKLLSTPVDMAVTRLKSMAFDCNCGGLFVPIGQKGSMFRCLLCNKEAINHAYNLDRPNYINTLHKQPHKPLIDMYFYDNAVLLLKNSQTQKLRLKQLKYRLKS